MRWPALPLQSGLLLETMLRSMAHVDAGDHMDVHGPWCHQKPSGSPSLTVKDMEITSVVVLITIDSQLKKGDREGFCDNFYFHHPTLQKRKSNSLDTKPSKRITKNLVGMLK